ncbi:hypothetical protein M8818_005691 [Zalaria obscura]|uniref:Uncharacterized protein n=1 Tax=Zalaria obscura TaxID=2024903 RepID=A0ACC3SBT7_9PEZI
MDTLGIVPPISPPPGSSEQLALLLPYSAGLSFLQLAVNLTGTLAREEKRWATHVEWTSHFCPSADVGSLSWLGGVFAERPSDLMWRQIAGQQPPAAQHT